MRECYFCGAHREEVLEDHHIIPKEVVVSEADREKEVTEETVALCGNCHSKMHHLLDYLIQFYSEKLRRREASEFEKASEL